MRSHSLAFAILMGLALPSHAHGTDAHVGKTQAVTKEQKPWGIAGDRKRVKRTVEIRMLDTMRFEPDTIDIRQGETLRLVVRNTGGVLHELVIGTKQELDEHAALMAKFPNMEHDEPYMSHVAPGKTGELVWDFNRAGNFSFACLIPGHYEAGMIGKINVRPARSAAVSDSFATVAFAPEGNLTNGEVRKIDKSTKKVTIRHDEIKNLGMPAMTMVFEVKDAAALDQLKPGDKVRFEAEQSGTAIVVTHIEVVH